MYSGSGFSDWEIGDITVIINKGLYHLFHLIIPNHDYIAHAVSRDGISWKRTKNALFVGEPGEWDDDMLWTMHVCEVGDKFEMYYTGLKRKDRGVISRIGLAESDNLLDWKKNTRNIFPIGPKGIYYETFATNPRTWLSFRDPFRFEYKDEVYLLVASRVLAGPVSRRGCVGMVRLTETGYELMPPLFNPLVYDDIECPCVFELEGKFYLIGSIREDIKVRYWIADDFFGEYRCFHADVLLPQGNYAARILQDGDHLLIYNFFYAYGRIDALRVLPPPKELAADAAGRLVLKSYYRWEEKVVEQIAQHSIGKPRTLFGNPSAVLYADDQRWTVGSRSGYEIFCIARPSPAFIWEGELSVEGLGKFGLVFDMDDEGNGYFVSFNRINGEVRMRTWGFNPINNRENFVFKDLQRSFYIVSNPNSFRFRLLRYGHYIELSVDDEVRLTLIDYAYSFHNIGLYTASSTVTLRNAQLKLLSEPEEEYGSQEEEV
jgi:beta-fructofuranosidase